LDAIAARVGSSTRQTLRWLIPLAERMLAFYDGSSGGHRFRLAPFVVGIYEGSLDRLNRDVAELFEQYWQEGFGAQVMGVQPALHRVVPAQGSASPRILPTTTPERSCSRTRPSASVTAFNGAAAPKGVLCSVKNCRASAARRPRPGRRLEERR
jgi:hypothetical protein